MKKVLSAFALALLLVGCAKEYDDSELKNRVTTLETKVGNLEAQMTAANKVALGQYVQKVEKTEEGVTVTYGDGTVVALKISGGAGAGTLGVVQKDGLLYWAVDGVVLQHEGKDLLVSQVSNIYVEDGKLYADIAGNKTELGGFSGGASLQDGIFKNIEVTAENVVLTLSDNSTVNIPIGSAFKLVIAKTQYQVTTTDPFDVPYTVNAKINGTEVDIFTDANYKATVEADKFVITPKAVAEGSALAYADSKVGLTSIVKLNFGAEGEADYANVTDEPADPGNNIDYIAESADAAVDVHIVSNVSLDKNSIQPQVDWISVSEVKANNYTITLVLEDNTTDQIRTGEVWVLEAGTGNKLQTIVVAQKAKEEVPEVKNWYNPQGWNKVFDMSSYKTNSTFMLGDGITLTPGSLTLQWKFYANAWNDHRFNGKDGAGNQLFCNRLGEFANADESQSVLFRFSNDGEADGQLCLNAGALGLGQAQVRKGDKPYVWPVGEWAVMTLVSDGNALSVYCNDELIATYEVNAPASWDLKRFDLSMTWDDGSNWPLRQAFNGYTAYARVWSRALAASEIAATLCEVDANAEGLEIDWKFDGADEKAVLNVAGKNAGMDLDFTDCWDGNGNARDNSEAAAAAWTPLAGSAVDGLCYTTEGSGGGDTEPQNPDQSFNPAGWENVFDMSSYKSNSTFMLGDGITLTPGSLTLQWKFYANAWNDHKFNSKDGAGNQLFCNRLGEFANADESQSVLFRFSNDGDADGQLCLNAGVLGVNQVQVSKDNKAYAWPAGEWVVMTLVSDGANLNIYCNDTLIQTVAAQGASSWSLKRFDLSMTWDDGSNWPLRQAFNGYTAYARVWSRALAASEIAATLCEVDADAEGLEIDWKFDGADEKAVLNAASKNADMVLDFTDCWDGNGNARDNSEAAAAAWTKLEGSALPGICHVAE